MNKRFISGLVALAAAAAIGSANAQVPPPPPPQGPAAQMPARGARMFHGPKLNLSEEQRDQIWRIRHNSALTLHDARRTLMKARKDLEQLTASDKFDQAQAKALADKAASAQGTLLLERAKMHAAILKVMTPEQRKIAIERMSHAPHGMFGPEGGMHRPMPCGGAPMPCMDGPQGSMGAPCPMHMDGGPKGPHHPPMMQGDQKGPYAGKKPGARHLPPNHPPVREGQPLPPNHPPVK